MVLADYLFSLEIASNPKITQPASALSSPNFQFPSNLWENPPLETRLPQFERQLMCLREEHLRAVSSLAIRANLQMTQCCIQVSKGAMWRIVG